MNVSLNLNFMDNINLNQTNQLQNDIEILDKELPSLSSITQKNITSTSGLISIKEITEEMKMRKIAYPNGDEIPLIKIKDKDLFESGKKIKNYLKNLAKFDDRKFSICKICMKKPNKYFYIDRKKHLCVFCHQYRISTYHDLIDFNEESKIITDKITRIRAILEENFIQSKKEKK